MGTTIRTTAKNPTVDDTMLELAACLIRDFQTSLADPEFCSTILLAVRRKDIPEIRRLTSKQIEEEDVARFKAAYQINSLFKRHRFKVDLFSDQELEDKAIQSFLNTQDRIRNLDLGSVDAFTTAVLRRARVYIAKVLGVYSDEEHRSLCRFGRRASVGIPARLATEAARWQVPITGSSEQITWFDAEMREVECVQEYWARQLESDPQGSIYRVVDSLKLTLVPKTFKSLRSIMPNTTIGSYMSYGLGEMLRKRLKRNGYDIKTLQQRHKYLAQMASMHGLHVTMDLSSASDSISVDLVNALFPSDWVEILTRSRIAGVELPDGTIVQSSTFCFMGVGFTFPLQTLVFLSLLHATQFMSYPRTDRRLVSVYGDDMIFATRMYEPVLRVFGQVGFVVNFDKTYHDGHFRESCGGDYFRGVDVRPFQPRNDLGIVGNKSYEAMLYKCVNGLLRRWSEHEVEKALTYLCSRVTDLVTKIKLVPSDYPDDSGVRIPALPVREKFLEQFCLSKPKSIGHGVYRFSFLRFKPEEREENRHEPYLWLGLRDQLHRPYYHGHASDSGASPTLYQWVIDAHCGVQDEISHLIDKDVKPTVMIRSFFGHRLPKRATFVTISHTGRYARQSGTSCFEDRRRQD